MPYIDLAGLSRYASRQKDRLERDYALLRDMQWTRSEKAGAVSLWPAGGTPLKPTVDFLFSETPPASGDKSPSNPSTITGVSSVAVTRANSNLIRWPYYSSGNTRYNVTWTVNLDGSISTSGTASASSSFGLQNTVGADQNGILLAPGTYLLSGCPAGGGGNRYRVDCFVFPDDSDNVTKTADYGIGGSLVVTKPSHVSFYCNVQPGINSNGLVFYPSLHLVDGLPFEKNAQNVYTIPLGGTYYGGTLDVASGVMTVTWVGKVLDGTETIEKTSGYTNVGRYTVSNIFGANQIEANSSTNQFCTHYLYSGSNSDSSRDAFYVARSSGTTIIFSAANESKDDFVAWLAQQYSNGTPVKIVCKVDTPYTVQLDPVSISALVQSDKYTPRLNTVYTDASAVQVGYVKSPIREEYELQQAVIAQGGNV